MNEKVHIVVTTSKTGFINIKLGALLCESNEGLLNTTQSTCSNVNWIFLRDL